MKRFMIMTGCVALAIAFAMPASAITVTMDDFWAEEGTSGWWMELTIANQPESIAFDRIQAIARDRNWPHSGAFEDTPVAADGFGVPGFETSASAADGGTFENQWSEVIRSAPGAGASTVVAQGSDITPGDMLSFRLNFSDAPTAGQLHMTRLEFFDGSGTNHTGTYDRLVRFLDIGGGELRPQFRAGNFEINGASTVIPEPMTMTLLGMGLAGVAVRRFRAKK